MKVLKLEGEYKYCAPRYRNCTNGPCPETTPDVTTDVGGGSSPQEEKGPSWKTTLGQAFMGLGVIMFLVAAVLLFVC